ncbi:MAG: hypothetical protein JXA21_26220 [Anaerolineae bacterium]|nr:hypothetical protein [Anaerolineae bacterium]
MPASKINLFNEKALHADLKAWVALPDDQIEAPVDDFIIDIVRGALLIEIQTCSFSSIKRKLQMLTVHHPVRLVYPIAREKWIVKLDRDEKTHLSRRKSPKRGSIFELFAELVSFPQLLVNPNFSLEVLFIREEELRRQDSRRGWRRKGWVTHERRLLDVVERKCFETPEDMRLLLPEGLPSPFATSDLAKAIARPRRLAQRMVYCLREMGLLARAGKRGNAVLYTIVPTTPVLP